MSDNPPPKGLLALAAVLAAVGAGVAVWQFAPDGPKAPGSGGSDKLQADLGTEGSPAQAPSSGFGAKASDAHVQLRARWSEPPSDGAGQTAVVRLEVADGWHINANPASREFLIPTRITVRSGARAVDARARYPQGKDLEANLIGEKPIKVYTGAVTIPLALASPPETGDPLTVQARVQACNDDGRCLAPATLDTQLASRDDPGRP